jgi:flavin reductase (DIM6/NTAB) family NADH-FMN oxidoreductase RutF
MFMPVPIKPEEDAVDQQRFRTTMASVCAPVAVVTAMDHDRPHGTTVSAFSSVSLDPPLVMIALDRGSDLLAILRRTGRFGVNLLTYEQDDLALRFAQKGLTKFEGVDWREENGLPRLTPKSGWLACRVTELFDGGDHLIAIGRVEVAEPIDEAPLVYHQRRFGTHSGFVGPTPITAVGA